MSLERLPPADLEALFQFVSRAWEFCDNRKEAMVFKDGLERIRTAQLNQFHRIIVEGKLPANANTMTITELPPGTVPWWVKNWATQEKNCQDWNDFPHPPMNQPSTNPEPPSDEKQ